MYEVTATKATKRISFSKFAMRGAARHEKNPSLGIPQGPRKITNANPNFLPPDDPCAYAHNRCCEMLARKRAWHLSSSIGRRLGRFVDESSKFFRQGGVQSSNNGGNLEHPYSSSKGGVQSSAAKGNLKQSPTREFIMSSNSRIYVVDSGASNHMIGCLLYTSPSPRD